MASRDDDDRPRRRDDDDRPRRRDDDDRPRRRDDDEDYDPRPAAGAPAAASNAAGLTLSIIGLVFGTLSLLFSFIPCVGALALWPGIVALVLSGIGLFTSVRAKALPITAVAVSALSIGFAMWQRSRVDKVIDEGQKAADQLKKDLQKGAEDMRKEFERMEKERQEKEKQNKGGN